MNSVGRAQYQHLVKSLICPRCNPKSSENTSRNFSFLLKKIPKKKYNNAEIRILPYKNFTFSQSSIYSYRRLFIINSYYVSTQNHRRAPSRYCPCWTQMINRRDVSTSGSQFPHSTKNSSRNNS